MQEQKSATNQRYQELKMILETGNCNEIYTAKCQSRKGRVSSSQSVLRSLKKISTTISTVRMAATNMSLYDLKDILVYVGEH